MASGHLDKLVRSFISGSSDPNGEYNPFADTQDPTYLSFKIDFFPDLGLSMPDDAYSSGGLLRPAGSIKGDGGYANSIFSYTFYDSAAEYLARIGAPTRQSQLEQFSKLLFRIQEEAPWYFQSVTGLDELYKIDPAVNFRAKDKILTVECLESIDLRMTLLADLYRNVAFDFENMREVLPINLRTFSMNIHVLEFRKFNTTFGIIADSIAGRAEKGQDRQAEKLKNKHRNVFAQNGSSLFSGSLDNVNALGNTINSKLGGMFTNLGEQAGPDNVGQNIESAFEAISIQTFQLKDCEFDFYSEAPGYLGAMSVKDIPEATSKFKIKVGKIQKLGTYSFYEYIIAEWAKNTRMGANVILGTSTDLTKTRSALSANYFEGTPRKETDKAPLSEPGFPGIRKAIFDDTETQSAAYQRQLVESDELRRKPLERALGSILGNLATQANTAIKNTLGDLTGGIIGTAPLGNVYGDPSFLKRATEALNNFLTPGNQLTTGQQSAKPPKDILGNILEKSTLDKSFTKGNVYPDGTPGATLPVDKTLEEKSNNVEFQTLTKDELANGKHNVGFDSLPVDKLTDGKQNVFPASQSSPTLSKTNVDFESLPTDQLTDGKQNIGFTELPVDSLTDGKQNVFPPPTSPQTLAKENVFNGTPELPTDDIGNRNVYK